MKLHEDLRGMSLCWLMEVKEEHPFLLLIDLQIAVATKWRKIRAPTLMATDGSKKYMVPVEKMTSLRNGSHTKCLYTRLPFITYSRNTSWSKKPLSFLLLRLLCNGIHCPVLNSECAKKVLHC